MARNYENIQGTALQKNPQAPMKGDRAPMRGNEEGIRQVLHRLAHPHPQESFRIQVSVGERIGHYTRILDQGFWHFF